MNKTYRTVFNTATGTYVAASELARGRKKGETALALVAAAMLSISGTALAADADDEDETDEDKPVVSTLAPRSIGTNSMIGIRVANEWGPQQEPRMSLLAKHRRRRIIRPGRLQVPSLLDATPVPRIVLRELRADW